MIIGYIRVSTDKQTTENQRFEILKFADEKNIKIDKWVEETVSGRKKYQDRKLGAIIDNIQKEDVIIVSELSRFGRSLMEVMSLLHKLMEKEAKVFTTKEQYELGNNINSQVLAFAFGLSAQIERNMISQRTKEALQRKKSEGMTLGRPRGSLSKITKLTGKDDVILGFLDKKVPVAVMARLLEVNRLTLSNYIKSRHLNIL